MPSNPFFDLLLQPCNFACVLPISIALHIPVELRDVMQRRAAFTHHSCEGFAGHACIVLRDVRASFCGTCVHRFTGHTCIVLRDIRASFCGTCVHRFLLLHTGENAQSDGLVFLTSRKGLRLSRLSAEVLSASIIMASCRGVAGTDSSG
jgi:hypothetical protein